MAGAGDGAQQSYDAIVVGAGFGGLGAATALAKAGRSVLVLERQDGPGGFGKAFKRGQYTFDPAIHVTAQGQEGMLLDQYLKVLGVRDEVTLLEPGHFAGVDFPDVRTTLDNTFEAFTESHIRVMPHEAEGIRTFMGVQWEYTVTSRDVGARVALAELDSVAARYELLFKYRNATAEEVAREFIADPRARALCTSAWAYLGLPPSQQSFATYSGVVMAMVERGPIVCQGSFQTLAEAMVLGAQRAGAEVRYGTTVTRIVLEDGTVVGVELDGSEQVRAPVVISNADAHQTFERLIGLEHLPAAYAKKLARLRESISACVLFAGTTLDVPSSGLAHETFVFHHWDHDETWADVLAGRPGGMWLSLPTVVDATVAPPGEHSVIMSALAPYDVGEPWEERKQRQQELLIDEVERLLPGFRDNLTYVELATPSTFERYTLSYRGAIYGWANIPRQTLPKRLPQAGPLPGLYLAGHWTNPGTGSLRALYSGMATAAMILGCDTIDDLFAVVAGAPGGRP